MTARPTDRPNEGTTYDGYDTKRLTEGGRDERTAFCGDGRKFGSSFTRELLRVRPTLTRPHDRQRATAIDRMDWGNSRKDPSAPDLPRAPKYTKYK